MRITPGIQLVNATIYDMTSDRLAAALRDYWLAWAEEHGAETSAELDARIVAALVDAAPNTTPRRHNVAEVAKAFGISDKTVRLRCQRNEYPHRRDGRRIYFTDEDLAAIADADRVPAQPLEPQRRGNNRKRPRSYAHLREG